MSFRFRTRKEDLRDLGFGSVVSDHEGQRLINRDGSFTVRREHLGLRGAVSLYHQLIHMSWLTFLLTLLLVFLTINALFATGYYILGVESITGTAGVMSSGPWWRCFFLSVHTITGVGYGNVTPNGMGPNLLMTLESFLGVVFLALTTGVVFARFSQPQAAIQFSRRAIVAPYRGGAAFMFRLVNRRRNELINLEANVLLSLLQDEGGLRKRVFTPLTLERDRVALFPMTWTVVHDLNNESPLAGLTLEDLRERDAEFLVMIDGVDETSSQPVYTRTSYKPGELLWGARFKSVFRGGEGGEQLTVDVAAINDLEPADIPV